MRTIKHLKSTVEKDPNYYKIDLLQAAPRTKDCHHLQRRQQQRGISNAMIQVALIYGRKHFHKGAIIFTLYDRNLRHTPYSQFTDSLRGLRVVCLNRPPNLQILTVYWHQKTKRRVHK
jgi:hypothetical protein